MPKDLNTPARARPSSRFFEPSTEPEFSWPPRAEDLESCAIVHLEGDDAGRMVPLAIACAVDADVAAAPVHAPRSVPVRATVRLRPRRAPRTAVSLDLPLPEETDAPGAARSAWLSVLAAAACVVLAYTQFRIEWTRGATLPAVVLTSAAEPAPTPSVIPAPENPEPIAVAAAPPRPATPRPEPAVPMAASTENAVPRVTQVVPGVAALAPLVAAYVEPPVAEPPRPELPRLDPPRPEPAAFKAEPITTRVDAAPIVNEEDDIRSTLTRWRAAYSRLDASAAQEVWPSVDVRALRTAFRGIKSQELHFDRCRLTVTGARAQAACSGRAVYVPGVGDRSPRTATREWNFELQKADEHWTIASASARSS
jgi:hypothetical protein